MDPAEVLVVWARVTGNRALIDLLDVDERFRLGQLQRPDDQNRFIDAHALLRIVVADTIDVGPPQVRLSRRCRTCGGAHGQLVLADSLGAHLSVSHAGDRVMVALSRQGRVGVDVEPVQTARFEGIEDVALTAAERLTFAGLERPEALSATRELAIWWTRKEAVLKCTGYGLAVDPRAVVVTAPTQPPALIQWTGPGAIAPMQLTDLDVGTDYVACVAVESSDANPVRIQLRDATEQLASWAAKARTTTV